MNKKKLATLLLVGTLLVGGGVIGTRAWFTSKADATSNLRVTMGTLKVEAHNNDKWIVKNQGNSEKPHLITEIDKIINSNGEEVYGDNDFKDVRPGDSLLKVVTIQNTGSLKQRLKFDTKAIDEKVLVDGIKLKDLLEIDIKGISKNHIEGDIILEPSETLNVGITANIKTTANNDWQDKNIDLSKVLKSELINVSATQVNNK